MDFNFSTHRKLNSLKKQIVDEFNEYLKPRNILLNDHSPLAVQMELHAVNLKFIEIPLNDDDVMNARLVVMADKEIFDIYFNTHNKATEFYESIDKPTQAAMVFGMCTMSIPSDLQCLIRELNDKNNKLYQMFIELCMEIRLANLELMIINSLVNVDRYELGKDIQDLLNTGEHAYIHVLIDYWFGTITLEDLKSKVGKADKYGILKIIDRVIISKYQIYREYQDHYTDYFQSHSAKDR